MDIDSIITQVEIESKGIDSFQGLEEFRLKYLGRKGVLSQLTAIIPTLPLQERSAFGQKVNSLKKKVFEFLEEAQKDWASLTSDRVSPSFDLGMPGVVQDLGSLHPLTQINDQICAIFNSMGFSTIEGPEVESEYNNFTGLNIPLEHPSREAFDTFYLKGYPKMLLRSHTSPAQVRVMRKHKVPLAVIVPGKVYRPDAVDASHSFMFHQIEGFMVDKGVRFSDLKGTLELFAKRIFQDDIKMRFRPHFFPFTEPSAEVDISCIICKGKGCSVCGKKGWLEILGAGMIHPNVLKGVGIDYKKYTGFAFGMGLERIAMLKYGINDIRVFFENDLRFLKQF
jgi:phenylalanyl-tRNA synthetase alpha chain